MTSKDYSKEFYRWLAENSQKMNKLLPTNPDYLEQYFSSQTPLLERVSLEDVIWWDVGRYQKFEEMSYEDQKIYIRESLAQLYEEFVRGKGTAAPEKN